MESFEMIFLVKLSCAADTSMYSLVDPHFLRCGILFPVLAMGKGSEARSHYVFVQVSSEKSLWGGISPLEWGAPHLITPHSTTLFLHDEAWPSVSPPAIQHLEKAPAPEVGSQVGKSMREMTQSAPIFLWSSALSMHCPDLTAEKPHARGPQLRWGGPQSSLYLESLPQRAILAEGPRCPSSAAWLILKLELGIILEEWVS